MRIILLIAISLYFSGCSQRLCEPEKIYVKTKSPKLKILYTVKSYEIKDVSSLNNLYYKINKDELRKASNVSQKRIHNIKFYEKQNQRFNKEFASISEIK